MKEITHIALKISDVDDVFFVANDDRARYWRNHS